MSYFTNFPEIDYKTLNGNQIRVVDITRRFKFIESILERSYIFYNYFVSEGDRPDVVAEKFYDDPDIDWIILLTNRIIDPHFEWHLTYQEFNAFIKKKYGSIESAKTTDCKYFRIIQKFKKNNDGSIEPELKIGVDRIMYLSLSEESRSKETNYEYEFRLNEERRNIKIIDENFIPQIRKEVKEIYAR